MGNESPGPPPRLHSSWAAQKSVQELSESRSGRPGLPVANRPDGFCERKATMKRNAKTCRWQVIL